MAPPGAQPDLADDATFEPRGHSRYNSTATQATLVADVAQRGASAARRSSKHAASDVEEGVLDDQRFRVTAGTPAGPTAATTTVNTGSPTAAASQVIQTFTAAALAVADPTTTTTAANERPSGAHAAAAASGVAEYEESSDDDFDYDQLDYDNVFSLPPGCKKIRIPIGQTGPDDVVDQNGRAWRVVRIDDLPPVCATQGVDEEDDWVLSGGADNDIAHATGDDNKDERVNDNGDNEDEDGGNDSDLDPEWQPPAELPKGPDAAGTIGCKDVRTEYNRERVAKETVALSKIAPTGHRAAPAQLRAGAAASGAGQHPAPALVGRGA